MKARADMLGSHPQYNSLALYSLVIITQGPITSTFPNFKKYSINRWLAKNAAHPLRDMGSNFVYLKKI